MLELIKRRTPNIAENFTIEQIRDRDGFDMYEIDSADGRVVLRGNNNVALACAYYRYLREFCNVNLSWCANTDVYDIPILTLPKKKLSYTIDRSKRMCLSYETYENGACWWDWQRWERELDFMAMNGVNMFLCPVGYEAVWYYAMLKLDVRREDAMGFLSGACYFPLQLEGKLDSYLALVDTDYLKARVELCKKIISRSAELDISPVLPGFNGHVPKSLKGYFTKSDYTPVTAYENFAATFRISPSDPLFSTVGKAMYAKQNEFFGTAAYYAICPFCSVEPLVRGDSYLRRYGAALSSLLRECTDDACWVLDSRSYSAPLVADVPSKNLLIVDVDGTDCEKYNGFGGHSFIVGTFFNRGGRTVFHGDISALADNPFKKAEKRYTNAVGAGVFPECTDINPMYSDLALLMLTENNKIKLNDWLDSYAVRRWGSNEKCLREAAALIAEVCYSTPCTLSETGSIIAARPSTELTHTAPYDTLELHCDNLRLCEALRLLLSSEGDYTEGYSFDVCDILRQLMSNYSRRLYSAVITGYQNGDARLFETSTNSFLKLIEELDSLLNTVPEFRLSTYLSRASSCAVGKADQQNFEVNLLCHITLHGPFSLPEYYDISWREWSDLVGGYYASRWHSFFELLASGFNKKKKISTVTRKQLNGRNLSRGNKFYKKLDGTERKWITKCRPSPPSEEDTLDVADRLFKKYSALITNDAQ